MTASDELPGRSGGPTEGNASPRAIFSRVLSDFWRCLPDLVLYDVLFKIVGFVLLSPLAAWLFRTVVKSSGNSALGNVDIARFLFTPYGVAASLVVVSVLLTINFLEQAGVMYIGYGAAMGRRFTYLDVLWLVSKRLLKILGLSFFKLLVYIVVLAPFALVALGVAKLMLSEHDINYYLAVKPREFQIAVALGGVLAVSAALSLAATYAYLVFLLPSVLLRNRSIGDVFLHSRALVRRNFRRVALVLVAWLLVWVAVGLVANWLIYFLGRAMVAVAGDRISLLVFALGMITAVNVLATVVLTFFGFVVNSLLIVRLYHAVDTAEESTTASLAAVGAQLGEKPQWSVFKKLPLGVGLVALVIAALTARQLLESLQLLDRVEISAHRGSSLVAPENTLSAVTQAIADGATFVEIDVQLTADRVLVVAHDADLMRLAGQPLVLTATPYAELRQADIGSSFSAEFAGETVPTLSEVIDTSKGKVKLIVELKSYAADGNQLGEQVVQLLRARGMLSDAVIMSLEYGEVQAIERRYPDIVTGFVSSVALGDISGLDVDFLAVSTGQATDALVGTAHAQGKEVYVWTVDDPSVMSTMIDRGVDNVITNDPAAMVRVLAERAELDNAERILLRFRNVYIN